MEKGGMRAAPAPGPEVLRPGGKQQLVGMAAPELTAWLADLGEPVFRSRQVFEWIYARGVKSFAEMTNLSQVLREKLSAIASLQCVTEDTRQEAGGAATQKFLFQLADGQKVESVLMRHPYGNAACITTQVGCRMGCTFCASTIGGLVRNLSTGEMVDQLIMMGRQLPTDQRVGHVVLMGSGEPLENYDAVLKAIRLMHDPEGLDIGYRHITLSTSGLVPAMQRLAGEGLPITLALSLHAPTDALRSELMPVNRIWPVAEVLAAARGYADATGRQVTIEYILIDGVNDTPEAGEELACILRGLLCHVNLIPMNPVAERPHLRRPDAERVRRFQELLSRRGISVTVRREMGGDIDAACGQLRNRIIRGRLPRSARVPAPGSGRM